MLSLTELLRSAASAAIVAGGLLFCSSAHAQLNWTEVKILNDDGTSSSYQEIPGHMASNGQQTVISASMLQSGEPIVSRSTDAGITFQQILILSTSLPHNAARVIYDGGTNWSVFWKASSGLGTVIRSTDDGVTWSDPESVSWSLLAGNGAGVIMNGRTIGGQVEISLSTTGGETWDVVETIELASPVHLVHVKGTRWLIYGSGQTLISPDNGATWTAGGTLEFDPEELESNHNGVVIAAAQVPHITDAFGNKPTSATISRSLDGGVTWGPASEISTGVDDYTIGLYYMGRIRDLHLMHVDGSRWSLVSHLVHREVIPLCCGTIFDSYSIAHLVETNSNGHTWTVPEFIWDGTADGENLKQGYKFYNAGNNLLVTWQAHFDFRPNPFTDRDLYYQTAALPEPPPPGPNDPDNPTDPDEPTDPEEPDMTLANFEGAWAPVTVKEKTKKKTGEVKSKIKGTLLITNTGQAKTEKSVVRFYLSADATLDPEVDVELKPKKVGKIKPGKSKSAKAKLKLTGSAAGNYLIAVLDSDATTTEWSESDNTVVSPVM